MPAYRPVVDLFAGVGGLSLGAARAGFQLASAVEHDNLARTTHERNFPASRHLPNDIASFNGKDLLAESNLKGGELCGLIGGPPCQGFSAIGLKATSDPRNELLSHFFRLVSETRPAFFLAENVPGVLDARNAQIRDRAFAQLPRRYVMLAPFVVTASEYGVPTRRTRVFFYGYDPDRIAPLTVEDFKPAGVQDVRVGDALIDLPAIRPHWQSEEQSWRPVGTLEKSEFTRRLTDLVPPGVGDEDALSLYRKHRLTSGFLGTIHQPGTIKRFAALKPGESDRISKCVRLDRKGYCPTLRAGTGPDRGSFQAIRPVHPTSARVIAPREAARLQGFPDWFQFHPTKWHAFRQIGNSVSPIVAEALLHRISLKLA